ncbi:hypothetical protein FRZ67_19330 [Panacibacter ginsenosidivorans]|uniref:Uncharacterized protein n=1 Tax=Panacibacter ginsenosidivorans TaxID=1813871 RepID=A0A5B8VD14_9BACT|nr:hypothetical protein [Panacibacter ginsenosidivorans]QEC69354.1 hypothetical protein FRZ67_19330 [Panacibacter ginsenosidivorans]
MDNLINYTEDVIHRNYEEDGCKYCFSIYPEYYSEEEALCITGRKHVVAITPQGTFSFSISLGKAGWVADNSFNNNQNIMVHINAALITGHSVTQN